MNDVVQQIVFFAFVVIWMSVGFALNFRGHRMQRAYFRQLPPVGGVPLDMYVLDALVPFQLKVARDLVRNMAAPR